MDKFLPSQNPPGNIETKKIPLFLVIGFDDNERCGFMPEKGLEGMKWAVDAFTSRKNPDGSNCSCAFYFTSYYINGEDVTDPPNLVKKSWKYAYDKGFEIGCHTNDHPDGSNFTVDEWLFQMNKCVDALTKPYVEGDDTNQTGIGIHKSDIQSFRAPFLAYNDNMIKAVKQMGFLYDSSMQEGIQSDQDGSNFYFPYTLDEGSPGNKYVRTYRPSQDEIANHPGIWEMPVQTILVPPDEVCEKYGIAKGLRKKCADSGFEFSNDGKIVGLDYNCLTEFQMTGEEFTATLKYNLDIRLEGNRAPFIFGAHTGIYSLGYISDPVIKISEQERRDAIEKFLDYAVSKSEVYVVSPMKVIEWMRNPYTI